MSEPEDHIDLGPCCACGGLREVRNVVMMDIEAPEGFVGWGCLVCGLAPRGAIYVLCDECVAAEREPLFICGGRYATDHERVVLEGYDGAPHQHDASKHDELW